MTLQIGPFPLLSYKHILFAICYWGLAITIGILLRKIPHKYVKLILIIMTAVFLPCEVYKAYSRISSNPGNVYNWLYYPYCALFVPALVYSLIPNKHIEKLGLTFLAFGCFWGGFMYMTNPGGGIIDHPLFHPSTIYGTMFHFSMLTISITVLSTGYIKPTAKDFIYYGIFMFIACVPSLILNGIYGSNLLFLDNPIGAPILNDIYLWCQPVYCLVSLFGQGVAFYFMGLGMYKGIIYIINKIRVKKGLALIG